MKEAVLQAQAILAVLNGRTDSTAGSAASSMALSLARELLVCGEFGLALELCDATKRPT
jgi:hypothetical protein